MSNVFSSERFFWLLKKDFKENGRLYFFSVLAMTIIIAVAFLLSIYPDRKNLSERNFIFYYEAGLFLFGTIIASISFSALNDKPQAISWFMLPASRLEKMAVKIFIYFFLFFIVYTFIFYCLERAAVSFYLNVFVEKYPGEYKFSSYDINSQPDVFMIIYLFLIFQSAFIYGSVCFKRFNYVYTIVSTFIVYSTLLFISSKINNNFFGLIGPSTSSGIVQIKDTIKGVTVYKQYALPPAANFLILSISNLWIPVLWTVTYLRIKEREV